MRQLKNIVEQTAIFEAGNVITSEILEKYLPAAQPFAPNSRQTSAPALRDTAYDREREMLLNMIFAMKKEIGELREMITHLHAPQPEHMSTALTIASPIQTPARAGEITCTEPSHIIDVDPLDQPAAAPAATLADNERTAIMQALERNDGRRKETARELNISERTLYRKIKEYGLE